MSYVLTRPLSGTGGCVGVVCECPDRYEPVAGCGWCEGEANELVVQQAFFPLLFSSCKIHKLTIHTIPLHTVLLLSVTMK
jgi:hypothetical protein